MWMRRNKIVDLFYILSSQELFDGRPAHDLAGVDEHRLSVGKKHKLRIALTHIDKRSLQIAKPCSFRLTALLGLSRFIRSLVIGLRFQFADSAAVWPCRFASPLAALPLELDAIEPAREPTSMKLKSTQGTAASILRTMGA